MNARSMMSKAAGSLARAARWGAAVLVVSAATAGAAIAAADLAASGLTVGTPVTNQNGTYTFPASFTVTNVGDATAPAGWYDYFYVSTDATLDGNDWATSQWRGAALAPGASYTVSMNVTSPAYAPGTLTVFGRTDADGRIAEASETNNTTAGSSITVQRPDLVIGNLTLGTPVTNQNGSYTFAASFTITNAGDTTAPAGWYDYIYVSTDATLDGNDWATSQWRGGALAPGASYTVNMNVTTPAYAPGTFTIFARTDADGRLVELNESNNTSAGASITVQRPDLAISGLTVGTPVTNQNGSYTFPASFTVTNVGDTTAPAGWYDYLYVSTNTTLDGNDWATSQWRGAALAPGASYTVSMNVTSPAYAPGTLTIFARADADSRLVELSETNNTTAGSNITVQRPDIAISGLTVGTPVTNQNGSYTFPASFTVTNVGDTTAPAGWYDYLYVSTDATLDGNDWATSQWRGAALAPGASYTVSMNVTSPAYAPGTLTIFARADADGRLVELSETNNTTAGSSITVQRPDLAISGLTVGTPVTNQNGSYTFPASFTVTNVGDTTAPAGWYDYLYVSTNTTLDGNDWATSQWRGAALAPGASYTVSMNVTSPAYAPGTLTIFARADADSRLVELNETNNTTAGSDITVQRPDLAIGNLTLGSPVTNQNGSYTFPASFTVTNVGDTTAPAGWYDYLYVSTDATLDGNDWATSQWRGGALAPGASYTVSINVTTPVYPAGTLTVFGRADADGRLAELSENNNIVSSPLAVQRPELGISGLTVGFATDNPDGSYSIPIGYTVTNNSSANALASWYDRAYLSTNATLDGSDPYANVHQRTASLAAGASYTVNTTFTTSTSTAPGDYTLFVQADGSGSLGEGNDGNNAASAPITLRIRAATTAALASTTNPSVVGQGTTLSATLTPATATGTVTFKDGTTTLGTSTVTSGVATLAASFGSPGAHNLTAVYSGDPFSKPVTSAALAQTVNKAPATATLTVSATPVVPNQSFTMTVSVTGASPTGNVTFKDGTATLATGALFNGTASLTTSLAAIGMHNLSVAYPGDANNLAAQSSVVTVEVLSSTGPTGPLTWTFGYDNNGNQRYAIDPNSFRTDRTFDFLGNVATLTQPSPSSGASRPVIGFSYDGQGMLKSVTDPRNLATSYSIDGLGNTLTTASPDTGTAGATYDAAGNPLTRTDARGLTSTYAYDSLNRLASITYASGVPSVFEYDGGATPVQASIGKLTRITDESGSTSYTHDPLGRVATKTQVAGSRTFTVGYDWGATGSANDKLTAIRYPSGAQVNYLYDTTGRVSGITVNPVNASGSGTNTGASLTVLSGLAYTGANVPRAWTWADGSVYQRTFDNFGRLVNYPLGNPAGSGASAGVLRTLSYDSAARITGYTHTGAGSLDQSFVYDGLDRLTNAVQAGTFHGYGYDATGNRTQRTVGAQTFVNGISPTSNRLTTVQDGAGTATIVHDAAGNIVSDALGTYTYSARGRLSAATLAGGVVQYRYNAHEQRVSKTGPAALVPTGASYYAYDEAGHLLGEYDADGVPRYETVYLGDTPVAVITQARTGSGGSLSVQTNISFVYADHIDTPRVITRSGDQAIVWRWDLAEAFGATPANDNPSGLGSFTYNQRFPGQVFDAETGLMQNVHREYKPALGRYVQADPLGISGQSPFLARMSPKFREKLSSKVLRLNQLYAYADSDPVSQVDPEGLEATAMSIARGATIGGARGLGGGLIGITLGVGIGALAEMCKPTDRDREERQCDADYDAGREFCHSMAVTKGRHPGTKKYNATYSQCMRAVEEAYVECYQEAGKQ